MLTSIEFTRVYVDKDLSKLNPKDYLVYQVDIRCLRRQDFELMLSTFYSQETVKNELKAYYNLGIKRKVTLEKIIIKRIKKELVLYDKLTLQVLKDKPSDNLYSLALETEYWKSFKKHVKWGALFGTYYNFVGNKFNFFMHLLLVTLTICTGYTLYTSEYFTTTIFLPFLLFITYLGLKSITMYWLFVTLRMREALEKLLLNGLYLSTSRGFVTLDLVVILAGVFLIAFF